MSARRSSWSCSRCSSSAATGSPLHARDRFGSLLAVGVTTQIALQVFLNIAVVTNLIPNTGISLPFFSYGGTALAVQLAEVGIVLSVSRQMR